MPQYYNNSADRIMRKVAVIDEGIQKDVTQGNTEIGHTEEKGDTNPVIGQGDHEMISGAILWLTLTNTIEV